MITVLNKVKLKFENYLYYKFEIFKVLKINGFQEWTVGNKIHFKFEIIISDRMKLSLKIKLF